MLLIISQGLTYRSKITGVSGGRLNLTSSGTPLVFSFDENLVYSSNNFIDSNYWTTGDGATITAPTESVYDGAAQSMNASSMTTMDYAYQGSAVTFNSAPAGQTDPYSTLGATAMYMGWLRQYIPSITASSTYTITLWVKQGATSPATSIRITTNDTSSWSTGYSQKYKLTSSWQRIVYTGKLVSNGASNAYVMFGDLDVVGNTDTDCVGNVLIYQAGINLGRYPARVTDTSVKVSRSNPAVRERRDVEGIPVVIDPTTKRWRLLYDTEV